jgi:hypothetical protein
MSTAWLALGIAFVVLGKILKTLIVTVPLARRLNAGSRPWTWQEIRATAMYEWRDLIWVVPLLAGGLCLWCSTG